MAARQRSDGASRIGRLRPGERPCWLELALSDEETGDLRRRAGREGLPSDVYVALSLEARLVDRELQAAGGPALRELREQARAEGQRAALAPTPELRAWVAMLRGNCSCELPDELPSLALPTRLVMRLEPRARVSEVLAAARDESELIELAVACDLAAALAGRTLESWAYAASLTRMASASSV